LFPHFPAANGFPAIPRVFKPTTQAREAKATGPAVHQVPGPAAADVVLQAPEAVFPAAAVEEQAPPAEAALVPVVQARRGQAPH